MRKFTSAAYLFCLAASLDVHAIGVKPVTRGVVVRAVNAPGPVGAPHTYTGRSCNFSQEEVGDKRRMAGASVNCKQGGDLRGVIVGLPDTFNAYCKVDAAQLTGRLIPAPVTKPVANANHCDLSDISPEEAARQFGKAYWR